MEGAQKHLERAREPGAVVIRDPPVAQSMAAPVDKSAMFLRPFKTATRIASMLCAGFLGEAPWFASCALSNPMGDLL